MVELERDDGEIIDAEEINFIYVHPVCKDMPDRIKVLEGMAEEHGAEIIYDERIEGAWIFLAEEPISDEEMDALQKNNEVEME